MIILDSISCKKQCIGVIENISVCVPQGAIVQLKGENGSGKTTLLKIIAGLNTNYSGSVKVDGYDLRENKKMIQAETQLILDKPSLDEAWTVEEGILFWAKLWRSAVLLNAALSYFGLKDLRYVKIKNLSAGQKRRVDLARLVACPAKIWLLDEPDSFLDSKHKEILHQLITVRANEGGIVLYTSHSNDFTFTAKDILHLR